MIDPLKQRLTTYTDETAQLIRHKVLPKTSTKQIEKKEKSRFSVTFFVIIVLYVICFNEYVTIQVRDFYVDIGHVINTSKAV